jgi:Sugar (and other) transporter
MLGRASLSTTERNQSHYILRTRFLLLGKFKLMKVIFNTSIGLSRNVSLILGGFNGVEYCLASLIPVFIIDRVGRRPLMLFSAAGQTICMAVLAITVHNGSKPAGEAAASMLFLFNTVFAVGWLAMYFCSVR